MADIGSVMLHFHFEFFLIIRFCYGKEKYFVKNCREKKNNFEIKSDKLLRFVLKSGIIFSRYMREFSKKKNVNASDRVSCPINKRNIHSIHEHSVFYISRNTEIFPQKSRQFCLPFS